MTPVDPLLHRGEPEWVRQEHLNGCAVATLAMLLGKTYTDIVTLLAESPHPIEPDGWHRVGTTQYHVDWALATSGAFIQRRFSAWGWSMEPFAPIHYAQVVQPSNNTHFVVVLEDGSVLDPMREGVYALGDWEKVNQIVGVVWP